MAVNRSVVGSVVRPVVRSVVRLAAGIVQRFFTTIASAGSQRWDIPQVLSGESVTMDVYPTNGNAGLPLGVPSVTDDVYQTITFNLTGNMDFIGYDGTNYFDGIIANVSVDGRLYPINETWDGSTVLVDTLSPPATEFWTGTPTTITGSWVDNMDGTFTSSGTTGVLRDENNTIADNETVTITYTVDSLVTGTVRILVYGSTLVAIGTTRSAPGTYVETLTIDTPTGSGIPSGLVLIQSTGSGLDGTISGISIKRTSFNGVAVNITSADADLFTQQSNGDWLGVELVVNGGFDTDTDWAKGAGVTISGGVCVFTSVSSNVTVQQDSGAGSVSAGDVVQVSIEVVGITLGQFKFRIDAGAFVNIPNTVGTHVITAVVGATGLGRIQIAALGTTTGSIDNVSVKQLIEVV